MNKNDFEIKNFKKIPMHDGLAFTGTVYVKGRKAFLMENNGWGGDNLYTPFDDTGKALLKECHEFVKTLPPIHDDRFNFDLNYDLDIFLEEILAEKERNAIYKRKCKKSTLFRLPEEDKNTYREIKREFSEGIKAWILAKYPNAIIINEMF